MQQDSVTITTITQVTNVFTEQLTALGWILVIGGLIMYWLKQADAARAKAKASGTEWFNFFLRDNVIEFLVSSLACIALVFLGLSLNPTDTPTKIADFMLGFGSTSALNGLISRVKPAAITPAT